MLVFGRSGWYTKEEEEEPGRARLKQRWLICMQSVAQGYWDLAAHAWIEAAGMECNVGRAMGWL